LAKKALFDIRYGIEYIQLQILATRPAWQRRGVGTALCQWGLELADLCSFSVAVFASPMGRLLYLSLGFAAMAEVEIRAGNEDERVMLQAMSRRPLVE
jgi:predicted N-acetyltransferase YhbS